MPAGLFLFFALLALPAWGHCPIYQRTYQDLDGRDMTLELEPPAADQGAALIAVAVVIGFVFAFLPTEAFIDTAAESPYYIIPRVEVVATR